MRDIINTVILAGSFLALFGIAELLYHKFNVRAEYTRKLVHIGTGLLTLLFPVMLHNQWLVLFLCGTFALIILASLKFNFLRSINGIDRRSHGSISYPVSVYGCYLIYNYYDQRISSLHDPYIFFYLPILTLAVCDPIAALAGKRFPYGKYSIGKDTKTLVGSSCFFVSSVLVTISVCFLLSHGSFCFTAVFPLTLLIAALATISEALSGKGVDNVTIPATVVLVLIMCASGYFPW